MDRSQSFQQAPEIDQNRVASAQDMSERAKDYCKYCVKHPLPPLYCLPRSIIAGQYIYQLVGRDLFHQGRASSAKIDRHLGAPARDRLSRQRCGRERRCAITSVTFSTLPTINLLLVCYQFTCFLWPISEFLISLMIQTKEIVYKGNILNSPFSMFYFVLFVILCAKNIYLSYC